MSAIPWRPTSRGSPSSGSAPRPSRLHQELEGTIAFVDISGFTKLSERLARLGKSGAEELTATIDTCFVTLLDLAVANGGRLLKFGGDALLVYFSGEAHEARACLAAIEMRRALRVVGRLMVLGQSISLRMSVGVHSGLFNFFLVGESHREFVVTGPGASAVVEMEGTADAGEIVISAATAAALRPSLVGPAKGPGICCGGPVAPRAPLSRLRAGRPCARPATGHPARAPGRPHHPYRAGAPQGHGGLHPLRRDRSAHRRRRARRGRPPARRPGDPCAGGGRPAGRHLPRHGRRQGRRQDHPDRRCAVVVGGRRAPDAARRPRDHGRRQPACRSGSA